MKHKILPCLLYGLPVLFFTAAYFLIVASGEDIFQGVNSAPDIIGDAIAAFEHSARLSDMYAWSIINFFNYRFSFGIDIIFRLFDVVMVFGIFYLMTDFIVGHRPCLNTKDSLIFCLCFICVILTPNGRILYSGFSAIHNYLIIGLSTLIFLTPYVHFMQKRKVPEKFWFKILMCLIGFIFGTASNITSIAAILTFVIIFILYIIKNKKILWKKLFLSWAFWGFAGLAIGVILFNILGSGINNYADSNYATIYDYLPFEQIFANPWASLKTILYHTVYNFGRFLIPILVILVAVYAIKYFTTKKIKFSLPNWHKNEFLILAIFIFTHLIAMTQIKYPTRLALPAYLIAVVLALSLFYQWLKDVREKRIIQVFSILAICTTSAIVVIKIYFAISYQKQISWLIDAIEDPNITDVCVNPGDTVPKNLPFVYLGQEDTIGDWAPITTNGITITYCSE